MSADKTNSIHDVMVSSPAMLTLFVYFDTKAIGIVEQCLGGVG